MSAPLRDLRAEARAKVAEMSGADVVRLEDAWDWLDSLPPVKLQFVCRLLGVTADEPSRWSR